MSAHLAGFEQRGGSADLLDTIDELLPLVVREGELLVGARAVDLGVEANDSVCGVCEERVSFARATARFLATVSGHLCAFLLGVGHAEL